MRHHADEFTQLRRREQQLQNPHQHHGCKQVLNAVFDHQCHHDHRQRTGGTRDHAGPAAQCRCDQRDDEGCIEPGQRRHVRDERKSNGFRHHGKRNGQAAEKIGFEFDG